LRRSLLLLPLLLAFLIVAIAAPTAARSRIALGASDPNGWNPAVLDAHIAKVGVKPALWSLWSNWGSRAGQANCVYGTGNCAFPTDMVVHLHNLGIDPVIWWQPHDPGNRTSGTYHRYARILSGQHDAYIRQWAKAAKRAGKLHPGRRIIIRFAHEQTGTWFPWGIGKFDNTKKNFKAAWRYVWREFKKVGALKYVRFLWSNVWPRRYAYPGDKYVDYVGLTILNFGWDSKDWRPMDPMVNNRVKNASKFSKKPVILAEVASGDAGGSKARWIKQGYKKAYKKYPRIKGIMWLDTNEPHIEAGHPDWSLQVPADQSALAAYRGLAAQGKFRGRIK